MMYLHSVKRYIQKEFLTPLGIFSIVLVVVAIWVGFVAGVIWTPFIIACSSLLVVVMSVRELMRKVIRPRRRLVRWVAIATSIVFMTPLYFIFTTADLSLVDESGLSLPPRAVPVEENAYTLIHTLPVPRLTDEERVFLNTLDVIDTQAFALMERLRVENDEGLSQFAELIALPAYQAPYYERVSGIMLEHTEVSDNVRYLRRYAWLYIIDGFVAQTLGEISIEELYQRVVDLHVFASRMEASHAGFLTYDEALAIRSSALHLIEELGAPAEVWARIEALAPRADDYGRMITVGYHILKQDLALEVMKLNSVPVDWYWTTFYLRPNKTTQMLAESMRWFAETAEKSCEQGYHAQSPAAQRTPNSPAWFITTGLWRENALGVLYVTRNMANVSQVLDRRCNILDRIERRGIGA